MGVAGREPASLRKEGAEKGGERRTASLSGFIPFIQLDGLVLSLSSAPSGAACNV